MQLIYLPHLDYVLQKSNDETTIYKDLKELDVVLKDLITFYQAKGINPIVLSEYGINPVKEPFHINRLLRKSGYIQVREENGLEILDAGASDAFAMADHQVAHIYINTKNKLSEIKDLLESCPQIELVLDGKAQKDHYINHERSGDLVVVAKKDHWFTYYYWLNDQKAPDFARTVDIHRKAGYDPVELFVDPDKKMMLGRVAWKLLKKKLGFRTLFDIIPLKAELVKGSHGAINVDDKFYPLLIHKGKKSKPGEELLSPTEICGYILEQIFD